VGKSPGTMNFYIDTRDGSQGSSFDLLNISAERERCGQNFYKESFAKIIRLDDFTISRLDFMKIDVEGFELEVLHGAAAALRQYRPVIVFELFVNDSSPSLSSRKDDFIKFFNDIAYDLSIEHIFTDQEYWSKRVKPKSFEECYFDRYTGMDIIATPRDV
jgi:hypothetical protein